MSMPVCLPEVIAKASSEDRTILASLLDIRQHDTQSLRDRLRSKSRNILDKASGREVSYAELLKKIGAAHGIRPILFETPRDFERRIVRTLFRRTQRVLAAPKYGDSLIEMKKRYRRNPTFGGEATGGASILVAQASGFGVYQMATTVMGMASSAAGITIPFIGYMALTKTIFLAIGPLGWAALGASVLHKLTKPKYSEMAAIVAWMFLVRNQADRQWTIGNFSISELTRKLIKAALSIGLAVLLIGTNDNSGRSVIELNPAPVVTSSQTEPQPHTPLAGKSAESSQSASVEQPTEDVQSEITETLSMWAAEQAQNDAVKTADYYAEHVDRYFLQRKVTREFVEADKEAFLNTGKRIQNFAIGNLQFEAISPTAATVILTKSWAIFNPEEATTAQGSTRSRVWLKRTVEGWKIDGEQDLKPTKE